MNDMPHDPRRRRLIRSTAFAGLALGIGGAAVPALAQPDGPAAAPPPGKPGDFDFLAGEWKIAHRQKKAGKDAWDEFDGEATCWTILGGVGSVEELRIPARDFSGMGLRLLDLEKKLWSDFWVNGKSGVLGAAGMTGHFIGGEGVFQTSDTEDGKPVLYRGVWDRIVPGRSHRWHQAASRDDGRSWDVDWTMDWRRA